MTEASEVGSIVGYLALNRTDWTSGVRATERDADRLGRLNPDIRISTNAPQATAQLAAVSAAANRTGSDANQLGTRFHLLADSIALIGPAAVPVAAVAGGAMIGLLPVLATVALGVKGISNQMKAGALQGTQFATDVTALKGELTSLQTVAASGLMSGIDRALQGSSPLFKTVNADVAQMSGQLGSIVGDAAPALLALLTQLNPLFVTFGQLVGRGAHELEGFAQHSDGVSHFVAYVQAELPDVMQLLGNLIVLLGHVAQGAAPLGGAVLDGLNMFVKALDAIPVGVLQTLLPLLVETRAVMLTYAAITTVMGAVNKALLGTRTAITNFNTAAEESAATLQAASLQVQAAQAEQAAGVAQSLASETAVRAAAAREAAQFGAAYDITAAEVATAAQVEADAATASAVEIRTAATAAATAVETNGKRAAVGWSTMLGPIGALAVGIGLFAFMLGHADDQTQKITQDQDTYAQSVKSSTNALMLANIQQTNDNLAKQGALTLLDQLHAKNQLLGVSYSTLTGAVNGSKEQFGALSDQLLKIFASDGLKGAGKQAAVLHGILDNLRTGLGQQIATQKDLNATNEQSLGITDRQAVQAARVYGLVGTTGVSAYLAAKDAADKNTTQTQAQTLAFQLENNAVGLVNQSLQTLAGQNLSNAQAQTALDQATLTLTDALKKNKGVMGQHTAAGVADRQAIEGAASALRGKFTAEAQATGSTEKATTQYHRNADALLTQIGRLDGTNSAAYRYAQQLLKIPPVAKTSIELLNAATAAQNIAFIKQQLAELPSYKTITVSVQTKGNLASTTRSQVPHKAAGGEITGPGPKGVDSVSLVAAPGEFVMNDKAVDRYGLSFMRALNNGTLPMPAGGTASSASAAVSPRSIADALHGTRLVIDAGSIGQLTGYIDARAQGAVAGVARQLPQQHGAAW